MTSSERLSIALATLQWGPRSLSRATGISERTIYRSLAGEAEMPERIMAWLERLAIFIVENPAPGRVP